MAEIGCERGGEGEISTTRSRPNHGFLYWRDSNHESNHGFPCSDNLNSFVLGGVLSLLFLFAHIYSLEPLLASLFSWGRQSKTRQGSLVGWLFGWLVTLQGLGAVGAETLGNVYGTHWLGLSEGRVG